MFQLPARLLMLCTTSPLRFVSSIFKRHHLFCFTFTDTLRTANPDVLFRSDLPLHISHRFKSRHLARLSVLNYDIHVLNVLNGM